MSPSTWCRASTLMPILLSLPVSSLCKVPDAPKPEPIEVIELPLPPVSADEDVGACTTKINPNGTGCIAQVGGGSTPETVGIMASGDFLPDNRHVISMVTFVGAPQAPSPSSIYDGEQVILIKTDGDTFPNGDPWKCINCGIPVDQRVGMTDVLDYPQSFHDGKRILVGDNVIDCGENDLASPDCTPEVTFVYPIHWQTTADGEGEEAELRELRIHPDGVHLGFSSFTSVNGVLGQQTYYSRMEFNPNPETGSPRYDLVNVSALVDSNDPGSITAEGDELILRPESITTGELRGFSGRGNEAVYIGGLRESGNVDAFSVGLMTGEIRRITNHPEYVDPIDNSPDEDWNVILDTRATTRHMFLSAMRGVPPLLDMVTSSVVTGVRNNGPRRFFQPWLLDKYGDREDGSYYGQKINGAVDGEAGSYDIDDPEWNAMADPRWSPDGTMIAYWQAQTIAPQCGPPNPLTCYPSKAQGGRTYRLMLAKLTSRTPKEVPRVEPFPDTIPWATPYSPGDAPIVTDEVAPGTYTLHGKVAGFAEVELLALNGEGNSVAVDTVRASYKDFSDDGRFTLNGWENATQIVMSATSRVVHWYSDLIQTGPDGYLATKKSGPEGFRVGLDILVNFLDINGTLITTVNGVEYQPPQSGT